jgi:hypothetical protein
MVKNWTLKTQYHSLKHGCGVGNGLLIYIHISVYNTAVVGTVQTNSVPAVYCIIIYVIINTSTNKCA